MPCHPRRNSEAASCWPCKGNPYPEWLTNVVLAKKENEKWRMCVNFTNLNKACTKDFYPLPSIDSLVDNASRCRLLSFLDAFSGYNQICMHSKDECKKTFMTEVASYCYKLWHEECRGDLSTARVQCLGICGRHGRHLEKIRSTCCRP